MTTRTDWRKTCVELIENVRYLIDCVDSDDHDPVALMECREHLSQTRTALSQPEPETAEAKQRGGLPHYPPEAGLQDRLAICIEHELYYGGDHRAAAAAIVRDMNNGWLTPQPSPVPVAERFEFSVFNTEYEEQAGGTAPTYAEALSYGQHYLSRYSQDGPHSLEIRRVEVLPHNALPVPGAEVG